MKAIRFSLLSLGLVPALGATGPTPAAPNDCAKRVARAYELLLETRQQQQGRILVARFLSEMAFTAPGQKKPQKNVAQFVLMARGSHTYLSDGKMDVYRDDEVQVCIVRPQRVILVTPAEKQASSDLMPWFKMRDELLAQSQVQQCQVVAGKQGRYRRVLALPKPNSSLSHKLVSVEYQLEERTNEMRKMTMYYPKGYGAISAGMTLQSQTWKAHDPAVDAPALSQVLGSDKKLLPAYRSFEFKDQRQN